MRVKVRLLHLARCGEDVRLLHLVDEDEVAVLHLVECLVRCEDLVDLQGCVQGVRVREGMCRVCAGCVRGARGHGGEGGNEVKKGA